MFGVRRVSKSDYQQFLRSRPWHVHVVLDEQAMKQMSDNRALELARRWNYFLCKAALHRRFSSFALDDRFHWIAVFQGSRDARNRHMHLLLYVPPTLWASSRVRELRLRSAVQTTWLRARHAARAAPAPLFVWNRFIGTDEDSRSVATYVSRYVSPADWNEAEIVFSQ